MNIHFVCSFFYKEPIKVWSSSVFQFYLVFSLKIFISLLPLVSTKRLFIVKQTCSLKLWFCLLKTAGLFKHAVPLSGHLESKSYFDLKLSLHYFTICTVLSIEIIANRVSFNCLCSWNGLLKMDGSTGKCTNLMARAIASVRSQFDATFHLGLVSSFL